MCDYYYDEFCTNDKCPYCADFCPVTEHPEMCKYAKVGDTTMPNEKLCTMNYETECHRLNEELRKMHDLLETAKCQLAEQSNTIAHLKGQTRAFEFCVTRGGADND